MEREEGKADGVIAQGLENVTLERMTEGFQATHANPMVGLDGRSALLNRLAGVLKRNTEYFGHAGRPGNMLGKLTKSLCACGRPSQYSCLLFE